jgi:hypothetical protein
MSLIERHGITEVLVRVSYPAAVEANEFWIFRELFNFVEQLFARQHADVAWVISAANAFLHVVLLIAAYVMSRINHTLHSRCHS